MRALKNFIIMLTAERELSMRGKLSRAKKLFQMEFWLVNWSY